MHEYGIVEELVGKLVAQMKANDITKLKRVRLKRGSTFAEGPLLQAFEILTENTPLKGTQLVIDEYAVEHSCEMCGDTRTVFSDDLIGHLYICPMCGKAVEIDEAHGLELLGIDE